jgi:hypothetical protein
VRGLSSLDFIEKDCWVFPLFEKGFPRINFWCLVHGYSSCDLGLLQLLYFVLLHMFMVQVHAKIEKKYMCLSHH